MLSIDRTKCTKCGLCAKSCSAYVIEFDKENGPVEVNTTFCNLCGHCVAICPEDAITNTEMTTSNFIPVEQPGLSYDQIHNLIRNRRSCREFKKNPINKEDIDKILNSVRYIPTAQNKQSLKYLIINNPRKILEIKSAMASQFNFIHNILNFILIKPFVPSKLKKKISVKVEDWRLGKIPGENDPYLRTSPTLLMIYAKKSNILKLWDAGIASYNILMVAETLGVASLWNGIHAIMWKYNRKLRKACSIPKKHKLLATIGLGYPKLNYVKTVDRNLLDIKIID